MDKNAAPLCFLLACLSETVVTSPCDVIVDLDMNNILIFSISTALAQRLTN